MSGDRRNYRRIWTAATVSHLGDGVTRAALPLLAASLTRSPTAVAAVTLAETLPWLFFALPGGAIADRVDRRLAMVRTDAFRMAVMAALGLAVATGHASIPLICVVAFALGSAATIFDNAAQAILPSVVERGALETANSRLYAAEIVTTSFIGPPLGALLFAVAATLPFLLDAGSFGLAALLVVALHGTFAADRPEAPAAIRHDIAEGVRWLWRHRLLRSLAIGLGVLNLASTAAMATFVLYALDVLHISKVGYGVLLTTGAIGGLFGTLVVTRMSKRLGAGTMLTGTVVLMAIATIAPGLWPHVGIAVASMVLTGVTDVGWNVVTVSLRQAIVPDHLLGRVNSAYRLLGWGTMPIGAALGGALATHFGLRAPFIIGGIATFGLALALAPIVRTTAIEAARAEAAGKPT